MIAKMEQTGGGRKTLDGNEAVANVAFKLSETIPIYPITPSSPMAEHCDEMLAAGKGNLWGVKPRIVQLQSEGGAAGTVHGAAMGGTLTTTFTASQGLLLMLPNLYKLAGELTPAVFHVTARAIATNALSIFGDHSDVMACRQTGVAMLASGSVQEAQDLAAIAHAASVESRLPFIHFFDGFRTSHELNSIHTLPDAILHDLFSGDGLNAFRANALTPDNPTVRGTAHNPDTYFQSREAVNPVYKDCTTAVAGLMARFGDLTGRRYQLFDYYGHPEAEQVAVVMGSGMETLAETARYLNANAGKRYGVVVVRLYRPFATRAFLEVLPKSVRAIAVLDRTKEPGSVGEPLYLDITMAMKKAHECVGSHSADVRIVGGRYGIGSKEFTPAMARSVFAHIEGDHPRDHFTVGIRDDVSGTSLDLDPGFSLAMAGTKAALFFGLGSDGTVGANKNTIKIIGDATDLHTQAYFVYDSKKSGGLTVSHLRFGETPIRAPYLVDRADFIGCHQPQFPGKVEMLNQIADRGVLLLNTPDAPEVVLDSLPADFVAELKRKQVRLYVIDAYSVAANSGMGRRINIVMQVCFFALAEILPTADAIGMIKGAIEKTYSRKGPEIVAKNCAAVDAALAHLHAVDLDTEQSGTITATAGIGGMPDFVRELTLPLLAGRGDLMPVSAFPPDGIWPTGTARFEKRRIATEIPVWDADLCTQCNKCTVFCPHSAIRPKSYPESALNGAPDGFPHAKSKRPGGAGEHFSLQVYAEDCTGCAACVEVCPAVSESGRRAIKMEPVAPILERERTALECFETLPLVAVNPETASVRTLPFRPPYFEFSGACAGCTQTPYLKLLTQLYGDRLQIANATGCSSIYGGNLPTTPYCKDDTGRGPAWANSLFEDNAEFGLGLHLAAEHRAERAKALVSELADRIGSTHAQPLLEGVLDVAGLREAMEPVRQLLAGISEPAARELETCLGDLVPKTTWIVGGDGWAYDIGFGGLDHILASGENVNILVMDTEVYSNTGGQSSKATPPGAVAKFAADGKTTPKKDLAQIAMGYAGVYVAQIAMGANEQQTLDALREAASNPGPSIVLAYAPCLAHGIDLAKGPARQKAAVVSGHWPLFRKDDRRVGVGAPALILDSFEPDGSIGTFMGSENRFKALARSNPERAGQLASVAEGAVTARWDRLEKLSTAIADGEEEDDDDGWS